VCTMCASERAWVRLSVRVSVCECMCTVRSACAIAVECFVLLSLHNVQMVKGNNN